MVETGEVHKIIDTFNALADLVGMIENEKAVGVDLEADSMYHFQEKAPAGQCSYDWSRQGW